MLKIYLDWNCINNIESRHPELYRLLGEYGDAFIFPYSNAHIRDLMMSHSVDNRYFDHDIELLTNICGKHHLVFENNMMMPKFCLPKDYVQQFGGAIELIQKTEFISSEAYQAVKEGIRSRIPSDVFKNIQGASPRNAIQIINQYVASQMPGASLQSLTIGEGNFMRDLLNAEARFKSVCLAIEMFGFRPEQKKKKFNNIDADASHIFYAAHCDYLVSADKGIRAKAEAMYQEYSYQTRVLTPEALEIIIKEEVEKEYSLANMMDSIKSYGFPREEPDGLHYTLMRTPVFGLFNACILVDEHLGNYNNPNSALFSYCFNNTPYLFYTELEHFFDIIKGMLSPKDQSMFQKYFVDEIRSGNYERATKARFDIDCPDLHLHFTFYGDSIAPVPCPMMRVTYANPLK